MKARKYDLVVFGASGHTGKYVVEEIVNVLKSGSNKAKPFTWAVAGRSEKKLNDTLKQASAFTGMDLQNVDKVIAEVSDIQSLRNMAAQCTVIMNTVGPYGRYGESVVKACLHEATNHVDISGELQYLGKVQVLYDSEAKDKHIYIVGSCGLESIPTDCGVMYLQKNFNGEIDSIESHFLLDRVDPALPSRLNIGSWNSLVSIFASRREIQHWQKKWYIKPAPKPKYPAPKRWPLHFSDEVGGWCVPNLGPDMDAVRRSQYYLFTEEDKQPIQCSAYFRIPNLLVCFVMTLFAFMLLILAQFKHGQQLLDKYAHVFTFGFISHEGPTREESENVLFSLRMIASGRSKKLDGHHVDQQIVAPNKKLKLVVSGANPGYSATAKIMVQSALTILQERDKMPVNGGVYTPGVAFKDTSLVERLKSRGIEFHLSEVDK